MNKLQLRVGKVPSKKFTYLYAITNVNYVWFGFDPDAQPRIECTSDLGYTRGSSIQSDRSYNKQICV